MEPNESLCMIFLSMDNCIYLSIYNRFKDISSFLMHKMVYVTSRDQNAFSDLKNDILYFIQFLLIFWFKLEGSVFKNDRDITINVNFTFCDVT